MAIVNVDYICSIKTEGATQVYHEVNILHYHQAMLNHLDSMVKDDNTTIFEMLSYLQNSFGNPITIDYCYPFSYWDTCYPFVDCYGIVQGLSGRFPSIVKTREQYDEVLSKMKDELLLKYKGEGYTDNKVTTVVSDKIRDFSRMARSNFFDRCREYIQAFEYYKVIEELKADSSIKMYSMESIGRYSKLFSINDDLQFSIYTNFRYGNSSFFYLNIIYKDIPLLFYSSYVSYYYARVADIVNNTRAYKPDRKNWPLVLKFVADTANLAQNSPTQFVKHFIKHEVDQMMDGLRCFMQSSNTVNNIIQHTESFEDNSSPYVGLRTIDDSAVHNYAIYPEETEIAFKMEKLSSALDLLESMKKFEDIYSDIDNAIEEIRQMNKIISPQLDKLIIDVESDIKHIVSKIEHQDKLINQLKDQISPLSYELERLLDGHKYPETQEIRDRFKECHPEYMSLLETKSEEEDTRGTFISEKHFRTNYMERLKNCKEKIVEADIISILCDDG